MNKEAEPRTKTVTLCGKEMTLTLRPCHACEEPCWFEPNVFVCNECSESYCHRGGSTGNTIVMSELQYQGDWNSQK